MSAYPNRILLAVAGLSPQIVTEALYALAVGQAEPWVPTQVRVITTSEGAERLRLSLLSAEPGWFARLLDEYALPPIAFDASHIEVLTDAAGTPLSDIRSHADNLCIADQICERVRTLCADPDTQLQVSIAGGRKTMGYCLGYALSLFGREQDRLSHVLVSEPFESSWSFFYPPRASRPVVLRDNSLADAANARVTLAEIPFLRLREGLPQRLLTGGIGFAGSIAAAQRALAPARLRLDLARREIQAGGEVLHPRPALLGFYALFASARRARHAPLRWDDAGLAGRYLTLYRRVVGADSGHLERTVRALRAGMTKEYFDEYKSSVNMLLRRALGECLARPYLIHSRGRRPSTRFGLTLLDPAAIEIAD